MRLRLGLLVAMLTMVFPAVAHAEWNTTWDFTQSAVPGKWIVSNVDAATPSAEGLKIVTSKEGKMTRETLIDHPIDTLTLRLIASQPVTITLLWHERGLPETNLVKLPINIQPGAAVQKIDLNLPRYPQWDRWSGRVGLGFPQGANLTIVSMEWRGWNVFEKLVEGWRTFWAFDHIRSYTINFVWGPIIDFNPIARASLFTIPPPTGWSAVRLFYGLLLLALAGAFARSAWRRGDGTALGFIAAGTLLVLWPLFDLGMIVHQHFAFDEIMTSVTVAVGAGVFFLGIRRSPVASRRQATLALLGMFATLWVVFDARMGLEMLGYARSDYTSYIGKPLPEKRFRAHDDFFSVVYRSLPTIQKESRFGFLTNPALPFNGLIKYLAFPSMPVQQGESLAGVRNWLVYAMPDVILNDKRQLVYHELTITGPGEIVESFGDGAFLFRTNQ